MMLTFDDSSTTVTTKAGALLDIIVDGAEHARRVAVGLGGVASRAVLADLSSLPSGLPVPIDLLDPELVHRLRRCATGVVDEVDGAFIRQLARPVVVERGTVHADSWRQASRTLSTLTGHCERHAVLPGSVLDDPLVRFEAERFNIGLWSQSGESVVHPAPFVVRRFTPTGWQFLEAAYRLWLQHPEALGCAVRAVQSAG